LTTRDRILDATRQIIEERGSARVTTKEIARAAGVAEGTLFKYFDRKDDLVLAVIREHLPSFLAVTDPEQAGAQELGPTLEAIVHGAIRYYAEMIPLTLALFGDIALLARHRDWMQSEQTGPHKIFERVAAYLAVEQRLGRIHAGRDPMSIAALLIGPAYQYAFLRHFVGADPLSGSQEQFVASLVATLLLGLTPHEPREHDLPGGLQAV